MEAFILQNDGKRDLSFTGELIARSTTKEHNGPASNRWLDLALYRTEGGKLICARVGRTCYQGESDRHEAFVAGDNEAATAEAQAIDFFGFSDAAKDLYAKAGIVASEHVD